MKITVLNGATRVGKSTVLARFSCLMPLRTAVLDGDDVGRCKVSRTMATEWRNAIQDNMLACAETFRSMQLQHLLMAYVFPTQERIDRLNAIFNGKGLTINWIALVLDDRHYRERIREPAEGEDRAVFDESVLRNQQIRKLAISNGWPCVDVTGMSVEQVCDAIGQAIGASGQ